jgi:class 3 adenylate cyclase/tetratricopeptide (TPR) repeat protein
MTPTSRKRQSERAGKSFGQLLGWHLLRGTRPSAPRNRAGRRWGTKEFAAAVGVSDRTVRFWLKDQHLPPEIETIERVLFGRDLSSHAEWRLELRHAHAATERQKGDTQLQGREPEPTAPVPARERHELMLSLFERRPMTVMACKFIGLASRDAKDDPENLRTTTVRLRDVAAEVVERFGGTLVKVPGDTLLIYFGHPEAYEDDPERAVRAGLELVRALRRAEIAPAARLRPRVGIATGTMLVGGIDAPQEWFGEALNLALALRSAVPSDGGVVIAGSTRALLGSFFDCEQLHPITLDDGRDSVPAWCVVGESTAVAGRFDALRRAGMVELVDRDEQMGLLLRRWQLAQNGAGQVVMLTGEAGIGKSRLATELEARISPAPDACLKYYGLPHQTNASMFAIIEELQRACGFDSPGTASKGLSNLEGVLRAAHAHTAENVALIAELLSLPTDLPPLPNEVRQNLSQISPQRRKQRIFAALLARIEGLAATRPLLVVAEDLQWVDPTSLEFVALLVERLTRMRVLMLVTLRSDAKFSPPWPPQAHVTSVELPRLSDSDAQLLVERVAGGKPLPKEVTSQILMPAEGVPLFVEEMTKSVLETVVLRERGQHYELGGGQLQTIPKTLNGSLIARLDRLGPGREIAQIGAVIGREFSHELLCAIASDQPMLHAALDQLCASELVLRRGTPPLATYLFKHMLVRDAAYGMLPRTRRQELHGAVAAALEQSFSAIVEMQPELLAHHHAEAGNVEKAVSYFLTAAERAWLQSAVTEARAHLHKALGLLATRPDGEARRRQELALQLIARRFIVARKGYTDAEAVQTLARIRVLSEALDDQAHLPIVMYAQYGAAWGAAEHEAAQEHALALLNWAENQDSPAGKTYGHFALGVSLMSVGAFNDARRNLESALTLDGFGSAPFSNLLAWGMAMARGLPVLVHLHNCLFLLGWPAQARTMAGRANAEAKNISHTYARAFALGIVCRGQALRRDTHGLAATAAELLKLCEEEGYSHFAANGLVFRGWALALNGDTEDGISMISSGIARCRSIGYVAWLSQFLAMLAESHAKAGDPRRALQALAQAQDFVEEKGERFWEAELYRLRGEIYRNEGRNPSEAEDCFLRALDTASRQEARLLELRAATSLASLWAAQGRRREAVEKLAPVYAWFTEGFDGDDLKSAKAILDRLA